MVNADLERWQNHVDGKNVIWDAPNYPNEITVMKRHSQK